MRQYASRDYRGAIPLLESAQRGVNGEAARFFLGISLLLDGRADEGIRVLDTLGTDRRSALAEDARFYSARGHLLRGDPSSAIRALDRTIELHGDREREARSLRDEIVRIGPKG